MSVAERFQTLLGWLEPSAAERQRYERHKSTVAARLTSTFQGATIKVMGSHGRGTALRGSSDLDLLCALPRERLTRNGQLMTSDTALRYVKDELLARYGGGPDVRKDGQAITIRFTTGDERVDVVPAIWRGMVDACGKKRPFYEIATGDGGWMATSPDAHDRFISESSAASGRKLERVAQLLKHWRQSRTNRLPVSSFYIELVLATSGVCRGIRSYAELLNAAFAQLDASGCAPIPDPIGVSRPIVAASTPVQMRDLRDAVRVAVEHSRAALASDIRGTTPEAYRQWGIVFNGSFPKS